MLTLKRISATLLIVIVGMFLFGPVAFAQRTTSPSPRTEDPFAETPATKDPATEEEPATEDPAAEEPTSDDATDATGESSSDSLVDAVCKGVDASGTSSCDTNEGTSVSDVVALVINLLSILVGVVAVIMIIVNGFKFVISNGDTTAVASARNGILWAIVGLVVVAMAQVIVIFVINRVDSAGNDKTPSALTKEP